MTLLAMEEQTQIMTMMGMTIRITTEGSMRREAMEAILRTTTTLVKEPSG